MSLTGHQFVVTHTTNVGRRRLYRLHSLDQLVCLDLVVEHVATGQVKRFDPDDVQHAKTMQNHIRTNLVEHKVSPMTN